MSWKFDNESPIYIQIMDEIKLMIAKGDLKPGEKIPAVREFAISAGVNPNTMQKALSELEREGVLYSQRTSGRFVSEDENKNMESMKTEISNKHIISYIENMRNLGFSDDELVKKVKEFIEGEDK